MDNQLPMHLAIRPLNLSDLDQVHALEQLSFAPAEAASSDAIRYRLTVAPELTSGLFVRSFGGKYSSLNESSGDKGQQNSTEDKDQDTNSNNNSSIDSDTNNDSHSRNSLALDGNSNNTNNNDYNPDEKSSIINERLIGHILSTKMHSEFVDDFAMQVPQHFLEQNNNTRTGTTTAIDNDKGNKKKEEQQADESKVGHVESSDVIGMHSVAVHPDFRGKKIGTLILHDYIQKLSNQQVASVISILAKPDMLGFYEKLGFEDKGVSQCKHGGEEWHDLQIPLTPEEDKL